MFRPSHWARKPPLTNNTHEVWDVYYAVWIIIVLLIRCTNYVGSAISTSLSWWNIKTFQISLVDDFPTFHWCFSTSSAIRLYRYLFQSYTENNYLDIEYFMFIKYFIYDIEYFMFIVIVSIKYVSVRAKLYFL